MNDKPKTHYRKIFKSDHLGVADIEDYLEVGHNLVFTISHVRQEIGVKVAGKKCDANIAYFADRVAGNPVKPWVLNAGNCGIMKQRTGSIYVEDWVNVPVQLYIDPSVKFGKETTGGVRIHPNPPQQKKELTPNMTQAWNNAIAAYKRDGNLNKVKERMNISPENEIQLVKDAQ